MIRSVIVSPRRSLVALPVSDVARAVSCLFFDCIEIRQSLFQRLCLGGRRQTLFQHFARVLEIPGLLIVVAHNGIGRPVVGL